MSHEKLAAAWAAMHGRLSAEVNVLVVDDDDDVRDLLASIVEMSGFVATRAESAEAALEHCRGHAFDLVIIDKNLPGHDGIDLIAQLRAEGISTPAVLVTGFPTPETISRALQHGADDYVAKPFRDIVHLAHRFEAIVEQRRQRVATEQIIADLRDIARLGEDSEALRALGRDLAAARQALSRLPDLLLVDVDPLVAESGARFLANAGLRVVVMAPGERLLDEVTRTDPLAVFMSLAVPNAGALVRSLRNHDPSRGIVVNGRGAGLEAALSAVEAGADDFVLGTGEGLDVLVTRVKRAAQRGRGRRMTHWVLSLLKRTLDELDPNIAAAFSPMLQHVIERVPVALPADLDFDDVSTELQRILDEAERGGPRTPLAGPMDGGNSAGVGHGLHTATTTVEQQIEHGLAALEGGAVPVPLAELLRAYRTLSELLRFFAERSRASDGAAVERFLGADGRALDALLKSQTELRARVPRDVVERLEEGAFTHPWPPYYLRDPGRG